MRQSWCRFAGQSSSYCIILWDAAPDDASRQEINAYDHARLASHAIISVRQAVRPERAMMKAKAAIL